MAIRVGLDMVPSELSGSGVGRYAIELEEALRAAAGVEVVPLGAGQGAGGGGTAARALRGLRREGWYYPRGLEREARAAGVDLVHCPGGFLGTVRDRPQVVTIHDVMPLSHPEWFPRMMVENQRLLLRRRAAHADLVITGSEHSRGEIARFLRVRDERIRVLPYGVHARFRPTPRDDAWLRERFGIAGRYLLCVGTLEPRKNLVGALRAFRAVAAGRDDVALVVAGGSGWRNEGYEQELALDPERVVSTGYVSDEELVRLYGSAAAFLFPSLGEGFGLPVLEAMACGAPVVASDRPSVPEVVGQAGLTADPLDAEAMAAQVERVLADEAFTRDLRERGIEHAARFSWSANAAATLRAYSELLSQQR
jgi:glycosyltransferase involved in cell wall biosynthesis